MLHSSEPYEKEKEHLPPHSPTVTEILDIIENDANEEGGLYRRKHLDKLVYLLLNEIDNALLASDPSPKMILHEPYRTVRNNVLEVFYGDVE